MNCYDCQLAGQTVAAAAVCTSCGAGLCASCVRVDSDDHAQNATPGNPTRHRTRSLRCASCDTVLSAPLLEWPLAAARGVSA